MESMMKGKRSKRPRIDREEEEDMAKCLMLLAQGKHKTEETEDTKQGFLVYECKTCSKCFPSFQALGGHRASHKKPRISSPSIQLSAVAAKARIHECSICGSEFNSGQALGGHMRRHRPLSVNETPVTAKKEGNSNGFSLDLDLNFPPPSCDDDEDDELAKPPPFLFSTKQPIVVLASSLVGCHY